VKVHEPVSALPAAAPQTPHPAHRPDRRLAYKAAQRSAGLWVPVECESYREALYLANGARRHATLNIEAEQRGSTVYLRYIGQVGHRPSHQPTPGICAQATLQRVAGMTNDVNQISTGQGA
jgi:hypothetical protein